MSILDLIFPKTCLGCGKSGGYICINCITKVRIPRPVCPVCIRPSIKGVTHPGCREPLGLDGLVCLWGYDGVVRKAILALKYKFILQIAREMSIFTSRRVKQSRLLSDKDIVLIPIPLYWYKKNFRGFNQTEEIGKSVADALGWRYAPSLLVKKSSTAAQTGLKRENRLQNIKGTFTLNSNNQSSIKGNSFILFDDVWTTGATLKEAAGVLKRAGAGKVLGLTLARGGN